MQARTAAGQIREMHAAVAIERRTEMRVEELMTTDVVTVRSETTLKEAAAILSERRISGLPVIDAEGAVIGVFSEGDVVFRESGGTAKTAFLARLVLPVGAEDKELTAMTVGEAMTSPAVTIDARCSVNEAAKTMIDLSVNRLPVIGDSGKLVGILTRADLVRAFVRSDDELAAEIRDGVISATLWLDPSTVVVEVHNGEVLLTGDVDQQIDAERLPTLVQRVPGVLSVLSRLRWRDPNGRLDRPFVQ